MGTSLSGLTPATTFDGLLKTSDNEPLDGTLKAISTGDGTDTILQLSNSALSIGGTLDLNFAGQTNVPMQFYGAGAQVHYISGGNNLNIDYVTTGITENVRLAYNVANRDVSIGQSYSMGAKLGIKGSGATSATTSLLVQNSAGAELFKVQDDGRVDFASLYASGDVIFGANPNFKIQIAPGINTYTTFASHRFNVYDGFGYNEAMRIVGNGVSPAVGIGETTPTARLQVKGSGNDNTTTSLLVQNSDGAELFKIQDNYTTQITTDGGSSPALYLNTGSGREGGDGGLSIGSDTTKFNINSRFGNGVINASSSLFLTSSVGIGGNYTAASSGTARLFVKGSGATSATTALLVQNSAGTELMSVDNDGAVRANSIKGINYQNNHLSLGANAEFLNFVSIKAPKIGVNGIVPTDTQAYIKGSGNDATTTALLVQNSDGGDLLTLTDDGALQINSDATERFTIANANGSASLNFRYNNIYTSGGNVLYISGASTIISGGGSERLRTSSTGTTIKGSGATSATTALLVQNSAGTELLKVRDDGAVSATIFYAGTSIVRQDAFRINQQWIASGAGGQGLRIGTSNAGPNNSAKLEVDSTTQGFLPPRMTTAQRDAITTPAAGLMVYNTTTNKAQCYNGTAWQDLF